MKICKTCKHYCDSNACPFTTPASGWSGVEGQQASMCNLYEYDDGNEDVLNDADEEETK